MVRFYLFFLLLASPALAQGQGQKQPGLLDMLVLPAGFLAIMYFLVIRPQQKKQREQRQLLENLKSGDEVVTTGGIIGRVKSVSDAFITLDVASGTAIKVVRNHVASLSPKPQAQAAAPKKEKG